MWVGIDIFLFVIFKPGIDEDDADYCDYWDFEGNFLGEFPLNPNEYPLTTEGCKDCAGWVYICWAYEEEWCA